jgi:hypothetical protein
MSSGYGFGSSWGPHSSFGSSSAHRSSATAVSLLPHTGVVASLRSSVLLSRLPHLRTLLLFQWIESERRVPAVIVMKALSLPPVRPPLSPTGQSLLLLPHRLPNRQRSRASLDPEMRVESAVTQTANQGPSHSSIAHRSFKHLSHIRDIADIPLTNVLVELRCSKHRSHIRHPSHIPSADVLVELRCPQNIHLIFVTFPTFHWPMSWLNSYAFSNMYLIFVTLLTSHWPMSWLN